MTFSSLPDPEASAIIAELGEAAVPAAGAKPFRFGEENGRPTAEFTGLSRIGERIAKLLRLTLEPFARHRPEVTAEPLETRRFGAWRGALPVFSSLSHYQSQTLKGGLLLAVEPEFVTRLVDAFYGGTGGINPFAEPAAEFTPSETRVLGRLADAVVAVVADQWTEAASLAPVLAAREIHSDYCTLVRADDQVVIQRFTVDAGPVGETVLQIVYPLAALRPFEHRLSARRGDEAKPVDREWRRRMIDALQDVKMPVRSVLARPTLSVHELLSLKPGDVIPITFSPTVPLLVANRRVAEGTIGEQDGRAALLVDRIDAA